MASSSDNSRKSNTQILQELEQLSESLYQAHTTTRRTASLVLPRTAVPAIEIEPDKDELNLNLNLNPKPRSRRMSLSPWRSRPKLDVTDVEPEPKLSSGQNNKWADEKAVEKKRGLWNWKPIRALSHITMQKLSCLFSVEVVTVQNLPASMNGLRLAVCVRKKENKDGAVQTMPSRVSQTAADFEETLFIRCHVYYTPGSGGTQTQFEPRPFLIYVVAVDAEELDFGRSTVDLSKLIQESIEKNVEGSRIRQWDTSFSLLGKAKGGEIVLKLGFQIMEKDGGVGIYSQAEGQKWKNSPSIARKQSKTSFSVPSPRMKSRTEDWKPKGAAQDDHLHGIDDLDLDEPGPQTEVRKPEEAKIDDGDLPDFDVVDKGVEIGDKDKDKDDEEEEHSEENSDKRSVSSEVVKEVVQDQSHVARMTELDSIAQQIKALESLMGEEKEAIKIDDETGSQRLDAEEDKVTREFLQLLEEDGEDDKPVVRDDEIARFKLESYKDEEDEDEEVFLPDLGKGLGCVIQTRNGGYLAAVNPQDVVVSRKDTPKLAMQMSKPMVIQSNKTGFEVFQKMAGIGLEEMTKEIQSLMPVDELSGKTAERIAFEGIASAIIQGRNREGASSSAARTIASVKSMANAMNSGRRERVSSGIWNVSEEPLTLEEILAFSMQKIESMAVDALKIQAEISEEEAPFDVSPLDAKTTGPNGEVYSHILASAVPVDDGLGLESVTISVVAQLRDPIRQYEAVGGPMIALIHATVVEGEEEKRYRVGSLQVGGVKVGNHGGRNGWDTEKQKLTALQWFVSNGMGKGRKKGKRGGSKGPDLLWSISSRIMADMWLKPIRNPDVKFLST